MHQNTPRRIDDILDSLDGIERAAPAPFLHTRILARMQREQSTPVYRALLWLSKPSVTIALSVLLLLVNGYVMFTGSRSSVPTVIEENSMALVQDYDVHYASAYEPLADEAP